MRAMIITRSGGRILSGACHLHPSHPRSHHCDQFRQWCEEVLKPAVLA